MKQIALLVVCWVIFCSFKADITGSWVKTRQGNIILFTRPEHYSRSNSPDSAAIRKILLEQNNTISLINNRLQTNFHASVSIYLFNYDEAKAKIGTNQGGFCDHRSSKIYFTFLENPDKNSVSIFYIGVHEMVHIVTNRKLGRPKSSLLGEGVANALDGTYGRIAIGDWMKKFIKSNLLVAPSDLLNKQNIPASIFYPQSGFFVRWLMDTYGVENVKKMYKFSRADFAGKFRKITGEDFDSMTERYQKYCNRLYQN